jgi:hypothetical protein
MLVVRNWFRCVLAACLGSALAVAGTVPGVVIDHVPQSAGMYIGSPSIAMLPNGHYVATHDLFGPKSGYREEATTRVFRSTDRGRSWRHLTDIRPQFWSTLFVHRKVLYLIGTTREYGDAIIRKSVNGGSTWTEPKDSDTGLLLRGRYHCAPQPVILHNGRIWRAMEDAMGEGGWGKHFRAFMTSASEDADLLKAQNWRVTNPVGREASWLNGQFGGWLEGNAVVTPGRQVVDILRVDYPPGEKAAILSISEDGKTATFDPQTGWIDLPGGATKFTIRQDPKSRRYFSLVNWAAPRYASRRAASVRNTVALVSSADLKKWTLDCLLLHHPDPDQHAFQYLDWQFDKNDIAAVSRTAWDDESGGAHNFHDADFMTFHRIRNFRKLSLRDSVVDPATLR